MFQNIRIISLLLFMVLCIESFLFATEARYESMGKNHRFFHDDISVFTNPADIGVYGNFLTGSLGAVNRTVPRVDTVWLPVYAVDSNGARQPDSITGRTPRMDTLFEKSIPRGQWFGGVYNVLLGKSNKLLMGAAFNRSDEMLTIYNMNRPDLNFSRNFRKDSTWTYGNIIDSALPRGAYDLFAGYGMEKKFNAALHYFHAGNKKIMMNNGEALNTLRTSVHRVDGGINMQLGSHQLEAAAGYACMGYDYSEKDKLNDIANSFPTISAFGRFFWEVKRLGITAVPTMEFRNLEWNDLHEIRLAGGMGMNKNIEGGFFWAGADLLYLKSDSLGKTKTRDVGMGVSFGIEKSMGWEWFLVRVGGNKMVLSRTVTSGSTWMETPDTDGSIRDLIGFGIGLNFQKRLRFDLLINEALPYFNPFGNGLGKSSNGNHMFLKISSTFSL